MFEDEYVRLVIKPKIDMILEDGVESIGDLTAKFNKAFECKVSKSRITEWLKSIGYRVTRTVQIDRPNAPRPVFTPAPEPAPARVQENFQTVHRQPRFDFPAPVGVFTNVQMPGFQE
jgi:hypothetical protein